LNDDLIWLGDSLAALRAFDVIRAIDMLATLPDCRLDALQLFVSGRSSIYGKGAALLAADPLPGPTGCGNPLRISSRALLRRRTRPQPDHPGICGSPTCLTSTAGWRTGWPSADKETNHAALPPGSQDRHVPARLPQGFFRQAQDRRL
jgi:hypothetical protein